MQGSAPLPTDLRGPGEAVGEFGRGPGIHGQGRSPAVGAFPRSAGCQRGGASRGWGSSRVRTRSGCRSQVGRWAVPPGRLPRSKDPEGRAWIATALVPPLPGFLCLALLPELLSSRSTGSLEVSTQSRTAARAVTDPCPPLLAGSTSQSRPLTGLFRVQPLPNGGLTPPPPPLNLGALVNPRGLGQPLGSSRHSSAVKPRVRQVPPSHARQPAPSSAGPRAAAGSTWLALPARLPERAEAPHLRGAPAPRGRPRSAPPRAHWACPERSHAPRARGPCGLCPRPPRAGLPRALPWSASRARP